MYSDDSGRVSLKGSVVCARGHCHVCERWGMYYDTCGNVGNWIPWMFQGGWGELGWMDQDVPGVAVTYIFNKASSWSTVTCTSVPFHNGDKREHGNTRFGSMTRWSFSSVSMLDVSRLWRLWLSFRQQESAAVPGNLRLFSPCLWALFSHHSPFWDSSDVSTPSCSTAAGVT